MRYIAAAGLMIAGVAIDGGDILLFVGLLLLIFGRDS